MPQYVQPGNLARLGVITSILALGACLGGGGGGGSSSSEPSTRFSATIERTTYGIPHITAADYAGAGYGHGYAIAEDNLCVLADAFITYRGERSQYFGPDAPASLASTFGSPPNLEADFFFRFIVNDEAVTRFRDDQPQDVRDLVSGFTAGYNRYVREILDDGHAGRHADCRNQPWLAEISEDDLMRRLIALNLSASSANWVEEIASAQPPAVGAASLRMRSRSAPELDIDPQRFKLGRKEGIGSNTFAFGSDTTETGRSLLLANPHWYPIGIDRFYQVHMTIPGEMDISGASIMGSPMVQMGFNDHIAWAHTVSTAYRFTLFELQMVPGDPTRYVLDGEERALEATELTVQVRQPDDSLVPVSRTLYRSVYGPMINLSAMGLPAWGEERAFTLRDVNLENTRAFQNFFAWNTAESLDEFYGIIQQYVGIPWVNTTAIGRDDDRALYSDITAVPNVPDSMLADCLAQPLGPIVIEVVPGLPLLDGSRSACNWRSDPDSRQPGAFGPGNLPSLLTTDYVVNMNDSYWLSNPQQPLTGYAGIIGQEEYQQSLRSRMGHTLVLDRLNGADGINGHLASSENIREISLNNRVYSAELLKDEILAQVCSDSAPDTEQQACQVLGAWNNTGEIDAVGAHVWSAFWSKVRTSDLYATPFDAADPVNTPNGLNTSADNLEVLRTAFSEAVAELVDAGIALDAQLGEVQFYLKPGTQIPQFGGEGSEGYFTVLRNSYMHVVDFPEGEPVRAWTFLTHGVTSDPASPHYTEYTEAYLDKDWHLFPYTREQIVAARISSIDISE
ncbi:acyl-homoserine-lactone acylase [Halopseudomonas formosensis]|uniref:Acyl-homoserine-lactone acylase n=1 Tax=Halopseudomonas formosensis TaxID=1002526 RepID=A0A1I6BMZ5_9GAMM|nr:penicillin acylase family protein [Halopseudomonas formosensis]SFQ82319.1 acyl-homoserine-lactone acylase [Halopseudomonas formosensis]